MPPTAPPPAPPAPASNQPPAGNAPPPSEHEPTAWLEDIGSELGDLDAGKAAPPRDDKGKFVPPKKPEPKPEDKPPEAPPKDDKPPEDKPPVKPPEEPPKPVKAAELRTAYEGLKKRVKEELEPEVQKLRSKVTELESKTGTDAAPLLEKVKTLEARNRELESQIEYVDYSQSEKFNKEYAEPYARAWEDAVGTFKQLSVRQRDGEDDLGDPKYVTRPADENDLLTLANMKLSEIDAAAQEMFGASAARAILHVEKIKDLSAKQNRALQEARQKAGDFKTQREAQAQQQSKALAQAWVDSNKAMEERFPKAYKVEEGDAEDAAAHLRGFALADLLFVGQLTPEQIDALPKAFQETVKAGKPLSPAQNVQLHTLARLKMANHDRQLAKLKKANARIAELEKALEEYEASGPDAGKAGQAGKPSNKPWDQVIEDEIHALDKQ